MIGMNFLEGLQIFYTKQYYAITIGRINLSEHTKFSYIFFVYYKPNLIYNIH